MPAAAVQAHAQGARGLAAALRATDEAACAAIERHTVRVHALRAVDLLLRLLQVTHAPSLQQPCSAVLGGQGRDGCLVSCSGALAALH